MLILFIFKVFGLDMRAIDSITSVVKSVIGDSGLFWVFAFVAYIVGYLASTIVFYIEKLVSRITRFKISKPKPEIVASIKNAFGEWVDTSDWEYTSKICQNYVEIKDSNFYFLKIDRLILLRNIELGLASVFLTFSIALFVSMVGWLRLYGFLPFIVTVLLFASSRVLNRETAQQIFISFYVLKRDENLKLSRSKLNLNDENKTPNAI
jgi:hypothetical protein